MNNDKNLKNNPNKNDKQINNTKKKKVYKRRKKKKVVQTPIVSNKPVLITDTLISSESKKNKNEVNINNNLDDKFITASLFINSDESKEDSIIQKSEDVIMEENKKEEESNIKLNPVQTKEENLNNSLTKEEIQPTNENIGTSIKEIKEPINELASNNEKSNKKINKILFVIVFIFFVILLFAISSVYSQSFAINKLVGNLKLNLNVSGTESLNFNMKINTSDNDNYNVLNGSTFSGVYESTEDSFKANYKFLSKNNDEINLNLLNKDNKTYIYDDKLSNNIMYKDIGKLDLSVNDLKCNIIAFAMSLEKSDITNYIKGNVENSTKTMSLKITDSNIDDIISILSKADVDGIYKNILNNIVTDMTNNHDKYVGTSIKLYSKLLSGKFIKLEIKNDNLLTISSTKDGYYIENLSKDNYNTKININKNNIDFTKLKGSKTLLSINIDLTYEKNNKENISDIDITKAVNYDQMKDNEKFDVKKKISSNSTRDDLISLYYYSIDSLNKLSMNVTNGVYYVYYNVPSDYNEANYTGKSLKKYINIDNTINYSVRNYNRSQVLDYINSEYGKNIKSSFYYNVLKTESKEIEYNGLQFSYQVITKTYDSNYADYDTTNSTLYVWYQIDDSTAFLIEYEYQGADITDDTIKSLLDIQVGK